MGLLSLGSSNTQVNTSQTQENQAVLTASPVFSLTIGSPNAATTASPISTVTPSQVTETEQRQQQKDDLAASVGVGVGGGSGSGGSVTPKLGLDSFFQSDEAPVGDFGSGFAGKEKKKTVITPVQMALAAAAAVVVGLFVYKRRG